VPPNLFLFTAYKEKQSLKVRGQKEQRGKGQAALEGLQLSGDIYVEGVLRWAGAARCAALGVRTLTGAAAGREIAVESRRRFPRNTRAAGKNMV